MNEQFSKNMTSNKKHFLILLGLMLLMLALGWWLMRPAVKSIKENNNEISYQKEKLGRLLQQGQSVLENKKNLLAVEAEMDKLQEVWLQVGEELKFITDLEQAAAENDLKQVINFDNTKYSGETDIKVIPVGLDVQGELNNIMSYINALEAYDYYINMSKVEIRSASGQETKRFSQQIEEGEQGEGEEGEAVEKIVVNLTVHLEGLTYWK